MSALLLLLGMICFLAYSNGANDNFKGLATVFGSEILSYKSALILATCATFLGSLASLVFASELLHQFSGKGLVPDSVVGTSPFLLAVAGGAGLTVFIASLTGLPISTTHSLTGALMGAGWLSAGSLMNFNKLGGTFFLPLLVSPFIAWILSIIICRLFSSSDFQSWAMRVYCLCWRKSALPHTNSGPSTLTMNSLLTFSYPVTGNVCDDINCPPESRIASMSSQKFIDVLHVMSGAAVCFARGLNDTPKIVALLIASWAIGIQYPMLAVAVAMVLGGIINGKKVAMTMSKKITPMSHNHGLGANLVTGFLVIFATRMGVPVSTTHVSTGSIFGIGTLNGNANRNMIVSILWAWVFTLPLAAVLGGLFYWLQ